MLGVSFETIFFFLVYFHFILGGLFSRFVWLAKRLVLVRGQSRAARLLLLKVVVPASLVLIAAYDDGCTV